MTFNTKIVFHPLLVTVIFIDNCLYCTQSKIISFFVLYSLLGFRESIFVANNFNRFWFSFNCFRLKVYLQYNLVIYGLMGWSLLPNVLWPFWDLLCSPNFDITRTWLNFAQRPIFSSLRFFNEPEISDSEHSSLKDLYVLKKNSSTSAGFQPANLGSRDEHVTPSPPRLTKHRLSIN